MRIDDAKLVSREYASLDRLAMRRLDRTGWLRFDDLDEEQTLIRAVAEVHPHRGGSVLWLSRRDLQTYLDAYVELYGPMLAPDGPYPFTATRVKCVFVADAA